MDAKGTNFRALIEGEKQFLVPLFQRTYTWQQKDVDTLWRDIADLYDGEGGGAPREHFIGSFVTMPETATPVGINQFILIDGQQRMTTLLLFMAALRQTAIERDQEKLANEIRDLYLTNQYRDGDEAHKLVPTQADRAQFNAAVYIKDDAPLTSKALHDAYRRARRHVMGTDEQGKDYDLRRLKDVITTSLSLVSITLSPTDNPYVIFQSLNGTGEELTQADLIRNYFFMRLPFARQQTVYDEVWFPMQEALKGKGEMDWFLRHFLSKDATLVNLNNLYNEVRARADKNCKTPAELEAYLREIARFAGHYQRILDPWGGTDAVQQRLQRLGRWSVTVAYPFLLNLYDDYTRSDLTEAVFATLIGHIESFVVRRYVCRVPSNRLNRIFITAYRDTAPGSGGPAGRLETLPKFLIEQNWPDDEAFREGFARYPIYGETYRCKLILELLNNASGHKEHVQYDNLTIDHVMPQTLTLEWEEMLGPDFARVYEQHLHTIGNLTLTGYNSELSNHTFAEKRTIYADSNIALNKYFTGTTAWDESEIEFRGQCLADQAVSIWPRPAS